MSSMAPADAFNVTLSPERVSTKGRNPPGEAIRGPSRPSTALDPEPTAQTDPNPTFMTTSLGEPLPRKADNQVQCNPAVMFYA
jgi:hypothetical protein